MFESDFHLNNETIGKIVLNPSVSQTENMQIMLSPLAETLGPIFSRFEYGTMKVDKFGTYHRFVTASYCS